MTLQIPLGSRIRTYSIMLAALCLSFSAEAAVQDVLLKNPYTNWPVITRPVIGSSGMVVSENDLASQIGAATLRRGGNAVDAAIATAFALAVTLPRAGNLGGDGFMTIYDAKTKKVTVIDFRSVAPKRAALRRYLDDGGHELAETTEGYSAPAVPGTVAGLELAHKRYGRLPWADLIAPAAYVAHQGFSLSYYDAYVLGWGKERLSASAAAMRTFFKADGSPYEPGDILRQPQLAWSLREIAREGAQAFYKGRIAKRINKDMEENGGLIGADDLASYRALERPALRGTYRGRYTIHTPPAASSGGATLINILNILDNFDLTSLGSGSSASFHVMAEAMKLGFADRREFLGDTDFVSTPEQGFISKPYAAARAKLISREKAAEQKTIFPGDPWRAESPQTTHFSVADKEGNAVSTTYTLGADFGSGVMIEGTGILLNNQINNFSHSRTAAAFARGASAPPNALQPGKRMLSTMVPTIVLKDGRLWLITGTPGAGSIINTVTQIIVNTVDFGMNIADATHRQRINAEKEFLLVEPRFSPDIAADLAAKGHELGSNETIGSVQSIMIVGNEFHGASDPRRPGGAAVAP